MILINDWTLLEYKIILATSGLLVCLFVWWLYKTIRTKGEIKPFFIYNLVIFLGIHIHIWPEYLVRHWRVYHGDNYTQWFTSWWWQTRSIMLAIVCTVIALHMLYRVFWKRFHLE